MRTSSMFVCSLGSLLVLAAACGGGSIDEIDLPSAGAGGTGSTTGGASGTGGTTGGTGGTTGGTGGTTGGTGGAGSTGGTTGGTGGTTGGTGGTVMAGAGGAPPATGGVGGSVGGVGGSGGMPMGGTAGTGVDPMGGMPGTGGASPMGGMGGAGAEAGGGGSGGAPPTGPYAARTGPFKVLAYFKTSGFTHTDAINTGRTMLMTMGSKQGFTVDFSDNPADVNVANLEQYEVFFGLNPTGNNLSATQKADFQAWMETKNGAFAGVHSSTDHENGWAFWSEVTGQTYDLHDMGTFTTQNIVWEPGVGEYVFVKGLPSPWSRAEEWYKFNSYSSWSQKPGFKILNLVNTSQGGTRPVSFIREWGNFRSFYTSLGHNGSNYTDPTFVHHVGAGIMWAARREALYKP